ncbi:putative arsenite efflux transporter ArsB-like protein [Triangularia verruculosa]|uniref:Arsenite efflux transporter ArsB-like protein n=1 Tax=Triangularia verruculosa TaxID=2587418 RepID=A0AAN7AU00_9PEZI|nr:putative arsenite efflux transporter ArsB-like protein [Triangularia verruculosa]
MATTADPNTADQKITEWRSMVTLIVFVLTNVVVLFPFHIPFYVPRWLYNGFLRALSSLRIISPRNKNEETDSSWVRLRLSMNIVTAPVIADLFLLAIQAIGRTEVKDGTLGADHIHPIDIMVFFITLAYIAISIDASGLIRYLAFKVLQWGGKVGHRLFFYLYLFFFSIGSFVGNDPIILSGTAFLAYMTRVSSNIVHPRAWIYTQFAVANIASAILVSSNPTNLVLAGAFKIRFIDYTANMVVPVIITAIVLFPFLLYIVFASESLIPVEIKMHELPEEARGKKPVNPNIPNARGTAEQQEDEPGEQGKLLSLEEIMNPFLDKSGAGFGAAIMALALISVLSLNAASQSLPEGVVLQVYWVTLPAAFIMLVWDLSFGWLHRHETRRIAREGQEQVERAKAEQARILREERELAVLQEEDLVVTVAGNDVAVVGSDSEITKSQSTTTDEKKEASLEKDIPSAETLAKSNNTEHRTLSSVARDAYRWSQETFPTATAVLSHLPYALVPFAFAMFVLVQALVTKGWVEVFARGWDHWVNKTGTVGAIGGMGFLSVILCNFSGTNIGTTILLSRIIQAWLRIHEDNGSPISERTYYATIYSMALGVNYGAFSTAISASLAGLLWRDILAKKHIHVRRLDFARVNLPIIAIAMTVGCAVLIGEIYIIRNDQPFDLRPILE